MVLGHSEGVETTKCGGSHRRKMPSNLQLVLHSLKHGQIMGFGPNEPSVGIGGGQDGPKNTHADHKRPRVGSAMAESIVSARSLS